MTSEPTDYELLDSWGRGDAAAGGKLLERHFETLYRFLRKRAVRDLPDLAQQTLLTCVERRDSFRRECSFRSFMLQIARYQVYAQYRKLSWFADDDTTELLPAPDTSPSGLLARRQDERVLLHALRKLPSSLQVIVQLSYFEGLSGVQIARLLHVPEATVRCRLHRSLGRLRRAMRALPEGTKLHDTDTKLWTWAEQVRAILG